MSNHKTLHEALTALVGTADRPIAPRVTQLIVGGGDLDVIKFYDLTVMKLDALRENLDKAPDVKFMGGDRSHPCIIDSAMLVSPYQTTISETCTWLAQFCTGTTTGPVTRLSSLLYNLSRSGDFAYQSRLQDGFAIFLSGLDESEAELLNKAIDDRAIPLTDCGVYNIAAIRSASEEIELYIPLLHAQRYPLWLVIVANKRGGFNTVYHTRLSRRAEGIRVTDEHIGELSFSEALRYVTGGVV